MAQVKKTIKREVVRAMLERTQGVDMEKLGAPKEEDAVHFDNVEEILNIPYMNRDEVPLGMDIFKPIVPEGTELPVMVTIHGGGLTMGDRKISRPFGRIVASKGYLVFSIEYRLAPRANVCMQLDDVCAGLDLVGSKLVDYDVDFNRIFIAAESAGAYLAAYVTAMKKSKELQDAIGYEPTRVSFKAVGLMSGMLYTNLNDPTGWMLSDQIYGEKRVDDKFLQYMNPEHPEIINNLPPAYLISSKGDNLNHYSFLMNEALKKAGKTCHFLYYGTDELLHAFPTLQTEDPRSVEAIDSMLAWFEEQAEKEINREAITREMAAKVKKYEADRAAGRKSNQKVSQYIRESVELYPERYSKPAILDSSRTYTYAQMFEQWDKYARVFTALGMTGTNKVRVGIAGTISAEPLFAYYGLNTVGATVSMFSYPDFLPGGRWKTMVEKEHITDLIISDIMVTPQMWHELVKAKEELGLNNVILLHTRMGGPSIGPAEMVFNEFNYHALKRLPDTVFMEDLIEQYSDVEIEHARKTGKQLAVITHTSGTANGTRKPLPFTDEMVNNIISFSHEKDVVKDEDGYSNNYVLAPPFDYSSSLNINGFVNYAFATGYAIATTFFGFMHPKFIHAYKYYKINYAFTSGFMIDKWMKMPDLAEDAFATIQIFGLGGSYVPTAKLEKYEAFLKSHGFNGTIVQGYGMSELAGASLIVPKGCREDIMGYPMNKDDFRIFDENDEKFYRIDEGERTGILYGKSISMCLNELDGKTLFELTEIDGKKFMCTNDMVHINEDGSLSYAGRANQFFTNNEGVVFEAGEVETLISKHPDINTCAIVPILEKRIHDTVPVLYVIPSNNGKDVAENVRKAIEEVYLTSDKLKGGVLPAQFVLVDNIPCNTNGKVDVYSITRNRLEGSAYNIIPVKRGEELVGIKAELAEQINSHTAGTLPEGMGGDSAFGVFEVFNSTSDFSKLKNNHKLCNAKLKEAREKSKEVRGELLQKHRNSNKDNGKFGFSMSDMMGADMTDMSKLPPPLRALYNAFSVLVFNQDTVKHDIDE